MQFLLLATFSNEILYLALWEGGFEGSGNAFQTEGILIQLFS